MNNAEYLFLLLRSKSRKVAHYLLNSPLFLLLLSALLFALSFPSSMLEGLPLLSSGLDRVLQRGLPSLIFLFALPLIEALRRLRSLSQAFFCGACYGFGSYLLLSLWLKDYDWIAFTLIPGIYLYYFSLFFAAYYLLRKWIVGKHLPESLHYLAFMLLWLLLEYAKSTGWVAYTYGSLLYSHYLFPAVMRFSSNFWLQNLSYLLILLPALCAHTVLLQFVPFPQLGTQKPSARTKYLLPGLLITGSAFAVLLLHFSFANSSPSTLSAAADAAEPPGQDIRLELSGDEPGQELPRSPDRLNVALLQHNINSWQTEQDTSYQALRRLLELSRRAEQRNAELIIWSETAFIPVFRYYSQSDVTAVLEHLRDLELQLEAAVNESEEQRKQLAADLAHFRRANRDLLQAKELQGYLEQAQALYLIGTNDYGQPEEFPGEKRWGLYNSLLLVQRGEILATYHKQRLVPFTEEARWEKQLPRLNALLRRKGFAKYSPGTGSPVLELPLRGKILPVLRIYSMICYEDSLPLYWPHRLLAPESLRRALEGDPARDFDILLSVSNDSWSPSPIGGLQHLSSSVSRALETRRYFLRGSTSGQTATIDPQGRLLARLPPNVPGILYFRLPLDGLESS